MNYVEMEKKAAVTPVEYTLVHTNNHWYGYIGATSRYVTHKSSCICSKDHSVVLRTISDLYPHYVCMTDLENLFPFAEGDDVRVDMDFSPAMKVLGGVYGGENNVFMVNCIWFDENQVLHREQFSANILKKIEGE